MSTQISFKKNLLITGTIEVKTGLHIGGPEGTLEIGAIDNRIIIDPRTNMPIIPGSSIKGKMRSLLEMSEKSYDRDGSPHSHKDKCKDTTCPICRIFGTSSELDIGPTRLIVRDAFMTDPEEDISEVIELKTENVINRLQGKAESPRTQERVSAGTSFNFNMVYSIYDSVDTDSLRYLFSGMNLLEDSYIGGSGTRGYGKITFKDISLTIKSKNDYTEGLAGSKIVLDSKTTFNVQQLLEKFNMLKTELN